MNRNRAVVIGSVLIVVVVVIFGWLLGIQPQLDSAAAADTQRTTVEAQNALHEAELAVLQEQRPKLPQLKEELAELRRSVPANADLERLLGDLHALAAASGVTVTNFTSLDAQAFEPTETIAPTVPASVNADNFVTIPITLTVVGPYQNVMSFVHALQTAPRLVLASGMTLAGIPGTDGHVTSSITALVYVLIGEETGAPTDDDPPVVVVPAPTETPTETPAPEPTEPAENDG